MEIESTCFAKIIDIINGNDIFLKQVPCLIGRISNTDRALLKDQKSENGKTIEIYNNYTKYPEIREYHVRHKLLLDYCKSLYSSHLIIFFDFKNKMFKIKPIFPFYLNESYLNENEEPVVIKSFDRISFQCRVCSSPHMYIILFPKTKEELTPVTVGFNNFAIDEKFLMNKKPDLALANKWTSHEKDSLRKYILIFGYGRWKIIKFNSGGVLVEKTEQELKVFSNAFIRTIIEFLPLEKSELKKFLVNLIDEKAEDPFILTKRDDWGTLIKQRAPAWGKRIQLIYRVCLIIEKFKSERKKNKEIRKKIEEGKEKAEIIEKLKADLNKTYDYWDNLLNFLPNHAFYGQRPSVWWTRTHDIDLLRGTYKYGYANYQQMRSDQKLSFSKLEKDSSFQEFPNADTITRRLKKLIQIIIKSENNNGIISFEDKKSFKEPTGFTFEEKNKILEFLINYGVPLNHEGKNDWATLKDQMVKIISLESSKTPQNIERLVQRLRMITQLVMQLNSNNDEASIDENLLDQMDPDNDNFIITTETAERLIKNLNILHFIRKFILINKSKLFNSGLQGLIEATKTNNEGLPSNWDCGVNDKNLLIAVNENGFEYLKILSNNKVYNFENVEVTYAALLNRINYLCEFFRDFSNGSKIKKKKDICLSSSDLNSIKKKPTKMNLVASNKLVINKDDNGNIICPVTVSSSLQILNFGKIEFERSAYHTEKNLFPIGFMSIREHCSMFNIGERALYTCEIVDGGQKPLFKLTPHEDMQNPIIKESCTGCWIVICNKINNMQKIKRTKVTISGTERFGLCEPNVIKILQDLPGVDKCSKYVKKTFDQN